MIIDGGMERRAVEETFDYVIVGSGAAGATAARVLADTGAQVAVVEEGPAVADFGPDLWPAFRQLYRQMGTQMARGRAMMPVLQASCLGGTTVVNSAIVRRLPGDIWQAWQAEHGLGDALPLDRLHAHWDQIEGELSTEATPPAIRGQNNRLMASAAVTLGVAGAPTLRNTSHCQGSARCSLGCPHGAKQSMAVTYLPYAAARGAVLFTRARVDRALLQGDKALGVTGHFQPSSNGRGRIPFTLRARKAVLVAASAIQTPGLLARSGVRSRHLGRHFQGHPGVSLTGVFDHKVGLWSGATQGFEIDEHRQQGRFKVETLALPPELLYSRLPGVGAEWVQNIALAGHMASWAVVLHSDAEGSVREGRSGPQIRFDLTRRDMIHLRRGLRFTAELFFAAGAREVLTGIYGLPERLTSADQAPLLENGPDNPACYSYALTHLFGTARMSVRPTDGVVGTDFAAHGTQNLFVLDSSVFPTNTGVNPQHTIMAIAMHAAQRIAGLS